MRPTESLAYNLVIAIGVKIANFHQNLPYGTSVFESFKNPFFVQWHLTSFCCSSLMFPISSANIYVFGRV